MVLGSRRVESAFERLKEMLPKSAMVASWKKGADWKFGDEWSVDLLVELPEIDRGHRQLLVATEAVSGYVEAYSLVEKSSLEVAICLQEMFWTEDDSKVEEAVNIEINLQSETSQFVVDSQACESLVLSVDQPQKYEC